MIRAKDQLQDESIHPHLATFLRTGGTLEVGEDFSIGAFARIRNGDDKIDKADTLLTILCDAFSFNPDDRWRFGPDDKILDIYRAVYSKRKFWIMADSMEVETLMMTLDEEFGVEIPEERIEVSLGEILEAMR